MTEKRRQEKEGKKREKGRVIWSSESWRTSGRVVVT